MLVRIAQSRTVFIAGQQFRAGQLVYLDAAEARTLIADGDANEVKRKRG